MDVRVGTSGFSYKEWKGSFYPEDLPNAKMLGFYAERFETVEINNTFYRMPTPEVLQGWASQVPSGFSFVLKASQRITHQKRLADVAQPVGFFFETAKVIADRLGPVLVQLPPYLKKDVARLDAFFDLVPAGFRIAIEVGGDTWLDDEVYEVLRRRGAALVAIDDPKKRVPIVPTADFGYFRLRETKYDDAALARWAEDVLAQPWKEAYVFFKHEDEGTGPKLGKAFKEILAARAGVVDPPA
jgi:uncharacterized protein YecE (DUF72 family)